MDFPDIDDALDYVESFVGFARKNPRATVAGLTWLWDKVNGTQNEPKGDK